MVASRIEARGLQETGRRGAGQWTTTQSLLLLIAVILGTGALYVGRVVFIPIAIAGYLSLLLWPVYDAISRRAGRWPAIIAIVLIVLAALGVLLGGVWYAVQVMVRTFSQPDNAVIRVYERILIWAASVGIPVDWLPGPDLGGGVGGGGAESGGSAATGQIPVAVLSRAASFLTSGLGVAVGVVVTLALAIFMTVLLLAETPALRSRFERWLGPDRAAQLGRILSESSSQIRHNLMATTTTGAIAGVSIGALCWGMGVPYPFAWGVLSFLLNYVPYIGLYISATPPTLLAFATLGLWWGLGFLGGLILIEVVVSNVVDPFIQSRALLLSPFLVVVSVIFWAWLWGAAGAVLCVPLTATIIVILRNLRSTETAGRLLSDTREEGPGPRGGVRNPRPAAD